MVDIGAPQAPCSSVPADLRGDGMTSTNELVAAAKAATGDRILVAGAFQPRGTSGSAMGGFASGTGVGSAVGESFGSLGEGEALESVPLAATPEGPRPVVAVSPSKIYVLRSDDGELTTVHSFHRAMAHVSVHSRIAVKTLEIEDPETRERVELEAERLWGREAKSVIDELLRDRE
jgi:hypothetical protein